MYIYIYIHTYRWYIDDIYDISLYMFAIVSCFLVSSMGFANVASGHVSYPTIVRLLCCFCPCCLELLLVLQRLRPCCRCSRIARC